MGKKCERPREPFDRALDHLDRLRCVSGIFTPRPLCSRPARIERREASTRSFPLLSPRSGLGSPPLLSRFSSRHFPLCCSSFSRLSSLHFSSARCTNLCYAHSESSPASVSSFGAPASFVGKFDHSSAALFTAEVSSRAPLLSPPPFVSSPSFVSLLVCRFPPCATATLVSVGTGPSIAHAALSMVSLARSIDPAALSILVRTRGGCLQSEICFCTDH